MQDIKQVYTVRYLRLKQLVAERFHGNQKEALPVDTMATIDVIGQVVLKIGLVV